MDIKHIVFLRSIMGCGIAQAAPNLVFRVMVDLEEKALRNGMEQSEEVCSDSKTRKMTEIEVGETLARIKPSKDIEGEMVLWTWS